MSTQEYLCDAFRIISENFRSNDPTGGMTAASAAYLVKRIVGDHRDYGFPKFKDVLAALSTEGRLRTGTNSKDAFSLWLTEGTAPSAKPFQTSDRFRPLRNQVWFAFIASQPEGKRYLHRTTGEARVGCAEAPGESWAEIDPISSDSERDNARQFLENNDVDDTRIQSAIDGERWYVDFPQQLATKSPHLAVEWKRERSSRVIDYVTKWCDQNDVDQKVAFESFVPVKPPSTTRFAESTRNVGPANDDLRGVLLEAIQRMSTDDLLSISIPASHLIAVLRPDLLR